MAALTVQTSLISMEIVRSSVSALAVMSECKQSVPSLISILALASWPGFLAPIYH